MSESENSGEEVIRILDEKGGYIGKQQELIEEASFSQTKVKSTVERLEESGEIEVNRSGKTNSYFLPGEGRKHPGEFQVMAKFILESDSSYQKTDKISEELKTSYWVEFSSPRIGEIMSDLSNYLEIPDDRFEEDFKFGNSTPVTWQIGEVRERYRDELEEIAGNPYVAQISKIPTDEIYSCFSESLTELYPFEPENEKEETGAENPGYSSEEDRKTIEDIMDGYVETEEQKENTDLESRDFTDHKEVDIEDDDAGYEGFT
ncbi:MAG: hypothetical protein ACI8Z7_000233 [Candidatus Nanohaloarchaea archaeon]|jgi:hypothetical protein